MRILRALLGLYASFWLGHAVAAPNRLCSDALARLHAAPPDRHAKAVYDVVMEHGKRILRANLEGKISTVYQPSGKSPYYVRHLAPRGESYQYFIANDAWWALQKIDGETPWNALSPEERLQLVRQLALAANTGRYDNDVGPALAETGKIGLGDAAWNAMHGLPGLKGVKTLIPLLLLPFNLSPAMNLISEGRRKLAASSEFYALLGKAAGGNLTALSPVAFLADAANHGDAGRCRTGAAAVVMTALALGASPNEIGVEYGAGLEGFHAWVWYRDAGSRQITRIDATPGFPRWEINLLSQNPPKPENFPQRFPLMHSWTKTTETKPIFER